MTESAVTTTTSGHTTIYDLIAAQAARAPGAPAILAPGRETLSYAGLCAQVDDAVHTLNGLGIGRGDRVAIVLPGAAEMAVASLAVMAGATAAPLNPGYRPAEFRSYLADLQVKALLVPAGSVSPAVSVARELGIDVIELVPLPDAPAGRFTLRSASHCVPVHSSMAQPDDVALVLHTSGTTAQPKRVPLTQANLCQSVTIRINHYRMTVDDRTLHMLPMFHAQGLAGVTLTSLAAGGSLVCAGAFDPQAFFRFLDEYRPTQFTAIPGMLQAIAALIRTMPELSANSGLCFIRCSAASLPPELLDAIQDALGAPVVNAYGMTEAAPIAAGSLTGNRKRGSVGVPLTPLAICDENGRLQARGQVGEIVIRGGQVFGGYENDPEANRQAFRDGWFRTGDLGYLDDEGYLFLTGRLKEMINRGGEKVSPYEVEQALQAHPAVREAVAFAIPHPTLGEAVGAAVVPEHNQVLTETEVRNFVAGRLSDFKVPLRVVTAPELPRGATGKLQRVNMAERLGIAPVLGSDSAMYVAPRTATERQLAGIWAEVLGLDRVGIHDDYFALGGYSILALSMFVRIEQVTGRQLPAATLLQHPTIEQLADVLDRTQAPVIQPRLVPVQTRGLRPPLFAAGAVLGYHALARALGDDQPFYSLRRLRDSEGIVLFERTVDTATSSIAELRQIQPHGPYYLVGYFCTAVDAFEMAFQLEAQGEEVAFLGLLDPRPPNYLGLRYFPHRLRYHLHRMSSLAGREKISYVVDRTVTAGWLAGLHGVHRLLRAAGAHPGKRVRRAVQQIEYTPRPLSGRLTLFRARGHLPWVYDDPYMGWGELAQGGVELYDVPAVRNALFQEPNVSVLSTMLRACLDRAREK